MTRELSRRTLIERSIIKKYRDVIWHPFVYAIEKYDLINEGDKIAVCISGGKDSFLLSKLMQQLQSVSKYPFEVKYISMDPGYSGVNRKKLEANAELLGVPIKIFDTNILKIANRQTSSPCYVCAKMRRGYLYSEAERLGCNKIALGHHFNDVIETTLIAMMYSSQLIAMPPKLHSKNFEGMELIRPLYCIKENDITSWVNYNSLEFIRCACKIDNDLISDDQMTSKRQSVKELIKDLKLDNPDVEINIFNSLHNVNIDTFPGYKDSKGTHSFIENY